MKLKRRVHINGVTPSMRCPARIDGELVEEYQEVQSLQNLTTAERMVCGSLGGLECLFEKRLVPIQKDGDDGEKS